MWEWLKKSAGSVWDDISEFGNEALTGKNLGSTLEGAGALANAFMAYDANEQNKEIFEYEKAEAKKEETRRNNAQAELDSAVASIWG